MKHWHARERASEDAAQARCSCLLPSRSILQRVRSGEGVRSDAPCNMTSTGAAHRCVCIYHGLVARGAEAGWTVHVSGRYKCTSGPAGAHSHYKPGIRINIYVCNYVSSSAAMAARHHAVNAPNQRAGHMCATETGAVDWQEWVLIYVYGEISPRSQDLKFSAASFWARLWQPVVVY